MLLLSKYYKNFLDVIQFIMRKEWLRRLDNIQPIQKYVVGKTTFLIYKVKDLYNPRWNHRLLKAITKEARKSYLRYGNVSSFDKYDRNAEVYLCRATDSETEEWLSLRFVPGQTGSGPLEDLGQYVCSGKPLAAVIKEMLLPQDRNFQNKLVAISRICGIPSYSTGSKKSTRIASPSSMKYTNQSFIFINKTFFYKNNFVYLMGVFRKELLKKLLHYDKSTSLYLPNAHEVLGCEPHHLYLNRNLLAHRFPGYFLNTIQLIKLLDKLVQQEKLSVSSVKKFVKFYNPNFAEYLKEKKYLEVLGLTKGLHKLLLAKNKIPGSKISGDELRDLVAKYVDDGPDLKIISVENWKKQLEKINV